jgi:hypothetical protein
MFLAKLTHTYGKTDNSYSSLERGRLQLISLRKSAKKEGHPAEKAKVKEGACA